ncbi:sensor histidine kinase [Aeromicrobium sp. YC3-14]|nr:sensor histidine kinase [Aeromicrobium stalagmiti]
MLVWQLAVVLVIVVGGTALAWLDARSDSTAAASARALDISLAVAAAPTVRDAFADADPSAVLQPYAERVRGATGTDFVTIMSPTGTRYSHPDPANIGRKFLGHIDEAAQGQAITEKYTGTLGPSVRAVVPVTVDGTVRGLVSVGITNRKVDRQVLEALPRIIAAALGVGLLGTLGAWAASRRLRRQTHGLGEREITRMYEYYDAVLRAVREGLLLLDHDGRLTLMNDEAARLLDLDESATGLGLAGLGLEPGLVAALSGGALHDSVHVVGDRVLVVNQAPARWEGREVGSVVTLRDRTELQGVTAELDTVRGLADALRAQNHESANRLHTMVSLIEIGRPEEAIDFATRELDVARRLADHLVESIEEPVVAALLLGKTTQAVERGVDLELAPTTSVTGMTLTPHEAVTLVGNLLDNAIDAAQASVGRRVRLSMTSTPTSLDLVVEDSGPGIEPADRESVFVRGWSTKSDDETEGHGIGLALVGQVVRRHDGTATIGTSDLGGARFAIRIGARP